MLIELGGIGRSAVARSTLREARTRGRDDRGPEGRAGRAAGLIYTPLGSTWTGAGTTVGPKRSPMIDTVRATGQSNGRQ